MYNLFKKTGVMLLIMTLVIGMLATPVLAETMDSKTITVLGTTDLHGRIYAHDYATDSGDSDAGLAKIQTLVKAERAINSNIILIDCGDTTQDNSAELFNNAAIHPMVDAMNTMGYDAWTIGNHEFNFEKSFLENNIATFNNSVLAANVYKTDGTRFVEPYTIIEKDGVRVAIVGLLPPHIPIWEASAPSHFEGLTFTDPLEEATKVVAELEGQYDVLIGAFHFGREGEKGSTGAEDIANALPQFDAMFLGHAHAKLNEEINGVKIIEPGKYGWALAKADIEVKMTDAAYEVVSVTTENLETKAVAEDAEILAKYKYVHDQSVTDANKVVGSITADFIARPDYITGDDAITTIPTSQLEDSSVIDLINDVQMLYTGSDVSSAALFNVGSNLKQGEFKKKDVAFIYKYPNTLVGVNITGENLLNYMEWSTSYYNTYSEGDVTVSFNQDVRGYNYDMFSGMTYDVDLSKSAGSRVANLLIDGQVIDTSKVYKLAVNNYRFGTLLTNGWVVAEDKYYDSYEVMQDAGRIRDLIIKYVQEEQNGVIAPTVDNNWKIIGTNIDKSEQEMVFAKVLSGDITIPTSEDGRTLNVMALNYDTLMAEGKLGTTTVPAPVVTPEPVVTPNQTIYIVQSGDMLWKVAVKFNTTWQNLVEINSLSNPNLIFPGQELAVPAQ